MHEKIKEHNRDVWLACTQTSVALEHVNKVKFIDYDPHWYTHSVKRPST